MIDPYVRIPIPTMLRCRESLRSTDSVQTPKRHSDIDGSTQPLRRRSMAQKQNNSNFRSANQWQVALEGELVWNR